MKAIGAIAIEPLPEDGLGGVIRCAMSPDLIAWRAEPWRFMRLMRVLGAAKAIAEAQLGSGRGQDLFEAIHSISDLKGDFTVVWKDRGRRLGYERIVDSALALEDESEILHRDPTDS